MPVKAIVLTGFGINCDNETQRALDRAGAQALRVHLNDVIADPAMLDGFQIMAIPGGFSFGDHVASGKILANRLRCKLGGPVKKFVNDGKLVVGICNGFQVMVKMGILPLFENEFRQEVTLAWNDTCRFENRWVHLRTAPGTKCVWLRGIESLEVPVRHGEGKFIPRDAAVLKRLQDNGQVALRYVRADGSHANGEFPFNPNGAADDIAVWRRALSPAEIRQIYEAGTNGIPLEKKVMALRITAVDTDPATADLDLQIRVEHGSLINQALRLRGAVLATDPYVEQTLLEGGKGHRANFRVPPSSLSHPGPQDANPAVRPRFFQVVCP